MRLGVYMDLLYQSDGETVSTDEAFVEFLLNIARHVDELVLFGRLRPSEHRAPYCLPPAGVRFVPLPSYPNAADLTAVMRSFPRSVRVFAREARNLDAVWLFGPHPLSLAFALVAPARKVEVFLGVRQDFPRYIAGRLPSRLWLWALPIAQAFEAMFRLASRRYRTVVVGDELARRYASGQRPLTSVVSLVRRTDLAAIEPAEDPRPGENEIRVLTVGRLDPEKNPVLLPEILARLRQRDQRWRFLVAGDGPLEETLLARAHELGVADALDLLGYVRNGAELFGHYRSSHLFLHVSSTEGLPQVLLEAQAARLPVVGTDVGSVASALAHGEAGLLVRPGDADAAAAALERLAADPALRHRLASAGFAYVGKHTMEAELARIAQYFRLRAPSDQVEPTLAPGGGNGAAPSNADFGRGPEDPGDVLLHPHAAQASVDE